MKYNVDSIQGSPLPVFVAGEYRAPTSGRYIDSFDPASGTPWYQAAESAPEDVDDAVAAAASALKAPAWRDITQSARGQMIYRLAELIEANQETLAQIETRDNGKLLKEMRAQCAYLPNYYRYYAGMADKVQGGTIPINKARTLNFTLREPLGVVGIIVPWNSPLYMTACHVAPCLAAGNSVVVKPSEHTSASAVAFAQLVQQAGFPAGVFNVVTGSGERAGEALTRHHGVAKIAFTGGTETGRKVAVNAGKRLIPCNLELGGKSPHVVFADADLDRAVNGVIAGIFAAAGQTCIAGSRCFVQSNVYDDILERVVDRARNIKIGHPRDETSQLGPLALHAQLKKVKRFVAYGVEDGASLVSGGKQPADDDLQGGWYHQPTIFSGVDNDMRIAKQEIFGPVLGMMKFDDEADLIAKVNDTMYGLAAGVWTHDIDKAIRFAKAVDAGTVWINTYRSPSMMSPAGGFKESGYGKHNGFEAMYEYTRLKNIIVDYSGESQDPFVMKLGGATGDNRAG